MQRFVPGGGILILGYCCLFKSVYGIFSLSTAKPRQDLYVCIQEGFYRSYPDRTVVEEIEKALWQEEKDDKKAANNEREEKTLTLLAIGQDGKNQGDIWGAVQHCIDLYGHKGISDIAKECFRRNPAAYIRYLIRIVYTASKEAFNGDGVPQTPFDNLKCGNAMVISTLEGIVMVALWIRRKRPPWVHMGLFAYEFPLIWLSFLVTNADFLRVMLYVVPPVYCSLALFVEWYLSSRQIWKERYPAYAAQDV